MKNVYAVLRQKELERSKLENEVGALRVVAPLLEDGNADQDTQPTLRRAAIDPPQPDLSRQASGKTRWP
jgi:hypothetical protein